MTPPNATKGADAPKPPTLTERADRLERANAVVRASRQNGPDEVLEIVKRRCPPGAADIHAHVPLAELQQVIDEARFFETHA